EKALIQERELNELKSRFVSMTSHEFRTPLTTIKQNVDLIEYSLEMKNPELYHAFSSFFTRISFEITRVTSLMNDMLLLGKIEAGKVEIVKKTSDLVIFSHQLIQRITAGRKDGRSVQLKVEGAKQPVHMDLALMEHVISNLLTNSLKYSEGKPDPVLTLSFELDASVKISIEDFGIGIPEEDQKGLFSSFFRAKNVRNIQGSGLGLSIVKEFVEMHGGSITVRSEMNKGSVFTVVIPIQ
ncbi:MAG: HAMP domain-containing histidine kinase, partial [Algoriphagus sp.]|nr:HAMP domain-containing histidine kinase [Algoriphagus sp.]